MADQHAALRRFTTLFPGGFAAVMATGIISIDARELGWGWIGWVLLAVNVGAWLLLWAAGVGRAVFGGRALVRDLARHDTGPGFLTLAAGTAVLGGQLVAFQAASWSAAPLFALAILAWWITLYGFLTGVTKGRIKPSLERGLSGQWLLLVVATQALASLGADLLKEGAASPVLAFVCYAWVLLGAVYYLLLSTIVLYRFAFVAMPPEDVTGSWWINAGAAAVTVLAGGKLMSSGLSIGPFPLRDLLSPVIVAFWADATFWIPLLLLLFAWKHLIRRRMFRSVLAQWSVVFPLGMYCAATLELESAYGLGFLRPLARVVFWVALVTWCVIAGSALRATVRPGWPARQAPR
ncbi:MAG: tellurite resistance/C4-dicarboxylate transporter family protein [Alphaproteobacteria bacterium]|nr:tellurite resistance/C4-dicarboxylate transporter family protein [Alphaproteobacteria bacterium]